MTPPAPGALYGVVRDALTGAAVSGVAVGIHHHPADTSYFMSAVTDVNGAYAMAAVPAGDYSLDFVKSPYVPVIARAIIVASNQNLQENASLTEPLAAGQIRITLTWGSQSSGAIRDLDSYLQIPGVDPTQPLYYGVKGQNYNGAILDHDDTQWLGPETVTINTLYAGTYIYYVNNYSDRNITAGLGNSQAQVTVYSGSSVVKTYVIPPGSGLTYEVFEIVNGQIMDVQQYNGSLWTHANPSFPGL